MIFMAKNTVEKIREDFDKFLASASLELTDSRVIEKAVEAERLMRKAA